MRRPTVAIVAALTALAVFVIGMAAWGVLSVTLKCTVVTSILSLDGITGRSAVGVRAHRTACIRPVPLDPGARFVGMIVSVKGAKSWPLELTLRGPGFLAHGRFENYAPGVQTAVTSRLDRVPDRAGSGELCVLNTGPRKVNLIGSGQAAFLSLPVTYLGATPVVDVDPAITFTTGEEKSVVERRATIFDHAAAFTDVIPAWLMWPLALLFVLGLPLGLAWALLLSARNT